MAAHPKNLHRKKVLILLDTKTKVQNKPFGSGARCTTYSEHFAVHFHAVISIHFCTQHSVQIRALKINIGNIFFGVAFHQIAK